jgi:hypothetical protein
MIITDILLCSLLSLFFTSCVSPHYTFHFSSTHLFPTALLKVAREVSAIPSATQVSALLDERVGWVKTALTRVEHQSAKGSESSRAAISEVDHLRTTLGARIEAVELSCAGARRLAEEVQGSAQDQAQA